MQIVYLDSFVGILSDILKTLFVDILAPVIRNVFDIFVNMYTEAFRTMIQEFLLKIVVALLKIIGFMENIFNVFSGVSNVEVNNKSIPLLDYFFTMDVVKIAFLSVTILAVVLAFVTTIISVTKSISDMALEDKTPLSTVLRQAIKACVTFLIVPVACLFVFQLTTQVVIMVDTVFSAEDEETGAITTSVSDTIFVTITADAKKPETNIKEYYSGHNFKDLEKVKKDFDVTKIDFFIAIFAIALIAIIMICSILQFIYRIFLVLILYIISPFFVSYIPLDGGKKFRSWRDTFVAHMISTFGPIICMRLYLIIVPIITTGKINFYVDGTIFTCVKLVFIVGGAFAVYKSRFLFVSIVNPMASSQMAASGIIGSFIIGKVTGGVSSMVNNSSSKGSRSEKNYSSSKSNSANTAQSQKYNG